MKKKLLVLIIAISFCSMMLFSTGFGWILQKEMYVSGAGDDCAYGALELDGGYPAPPSGWNDSFSAWRHPSWKKVPAEPLFDAGADWIWRIYKVTSEEAKTGSIVFFRKLIEIPEDAEVVNATIEITVDNALYFYVSNEEDVDYPKWSGEPIFSKGFVDPTSLSSDPSDLWEIGPDGYYIPKAGVIDIDRTVVRTITIEDLKDHLKPGNNWLHIVAFNAHPEPKSKQVSQNTAGLIYKLEVSVETPLIPPHGLMIPLVQPPPEDLESIPTFEMKPIQAAWDPDINDDGRIDLVLDKPMAVVLNVSGAPTVSEFNVTFDGVLFSATDYSDEMLTIWPIVPRNTGNFTIYGYYTIGDTSYSLPDVYVTVKNTSDLSIAYSYLYRPGKGNNPYGDYGYVDPLDYEYMTGNTTAFMNSTYPISSLLADDTYNGISGAGRSKRDPFGQILDDALAAAQDAQWRMGGSAFGIAIGPNNTAFDDDYFEYHGFPGAAGISFGPSVRGVVVLDGYYTGGAHEIAHEYSVYWGEPEQYQLWPPWGNASSGVDATTGTWRSGYGFMGAGPYRSLNDSWVTTYTFEELFKQTRLLAADPLVLSVNGYYNGTSKETILNQFIAFEGYPDILQLGPFNITYMNGTTPIGGTNFNLTSNYYISPRVGTTNSSDDFGKKNSTISAFAFTTLFEPNATEIWFWNNTNPDQPIPMAVYDADDIVYFDSWVTNSLFEPITGISVNFKEDGDAHIMQNANPGSLMYNVFVDSNGPTSLQIVLPDTTDAYGGVISPAFDLHSQNPIHIYSDMARDVDVTSSADIINVTGNSIIVNMTIPDDEFRYVTLHLDYAPEGTTGYEDPSEYYRSLPFYVSFINVETEFSLDQTDAFEAVGSG